MSDNIYYPPVPAEEAIADARRMTVRQVRERVYNRETRATDSGGRETRDNGISDDALHQRDLAIAAKLTAQFGTTPQAPSVRSDILSAELATARTRSERRSAVKRFEDSQRPADEVRFNAWLARPEHSRAWEDRAAAEATNSAGGYLVPPRFSAKLIHQMREYDGFLKAFELWESSHAEPYNRPIYNAFGVASAQTEGSAITDGPYPVLANQVWPLTPTYAASWTASFQLIQDAFNYPNVVNGGFNADSYLHQDSMGAKAGGFPQAAPFVNGGSNRSLDDWVSSALGESLGRVIAPVARTALYSGINTVGVTSGGGGGYLGLTAAQAVTFTQGATTELIANTINLDTAAQMVESLDAAYLASPNCAWYFSPVQWGGLVRQVDSQKKALMDPGGHGEPRMLYNIPVVLTSQTLAATASTASGPILGDLSAAMTLRVADGSMSLLRSNEKYAEFLQMFYRAGIRADVSVRDIRAVVGVKYAAS